MSEQLQSLVNPVWVARIRFAIQVLLVIAIGLIVSRGIWLVIDPAGTASRSAPLPRYAAQSQTSLSTPVDVSILSSMNPFAGGEDVVEANFVPDAPETALNLRLIGSRSETGDGGGTATIVTPDNKVNVFAPGDEILGGVTLEKVLTDQVLLRRNGTLESLRREGRDEGFAVLRFEGDEEEDGAVFDTRDAAPRGPEDETVAPVEVGEILDEQALLNSLRIEPELENGNVTGYRLTPRDDGALMAQVGLQPGDVLIGVDGNSIAEIAPEQVAGMLADGGEARLQVRRNDVTIDVDVALRR